MLSNEKLKKCWENAKPNDGFVFVQIMKNEGICIGVLETFLKVKIDHLVYLNTEETLKEKGTSKGIRMDVYIKDDAGTVYNVEMQRRRVKALPQRSRYYGSLIDVNNLSKGNDYQKLRKSFVIFICNVDPFYQDRCVYHFEYTDQADHALKLNDGTTKLFFYTRGKDKASLDPRLRKILEFFENNFPERNMDDDLLQRMSDEYYRIKANRELGEDYMTQAIYINDFIDQGYENAQKQYKPLVKKLAKTQAELVKKDSVIAEKEEEIALLKSEKDAALSEKDDEIAFLKSELEKRNREQLLH